MRKGSVKNTRTNSEVQRVLSEIIRHTLKDPGIPVMLSVTRCEVATDLKTCKVYISTLAGGAEEEKAMESLQKAAAFIRRELAGRLNLRNTPELTFLADHSIAYGMSMMKKIEEVTRADREKNEHA